VLVHLRICERGEVRDPSSFGSKRHHMPVLADAGASTAPFAPAPQTLPRAGEMIRVLSLDGGTPLPATVLFAGKVHWARDAHLGVSFADPTHAARAAPAQLLSNGAVDGKRYFRCARRHGAFVPAAAALPPSTSRLDVTRLAADGTRLAADAAAAKLQSLYRAHRGKEGLRAHARLQMEGAQRAGVGDAVSVAAALLPSALPVIGSVGSVDRERSEMEARAPVRGTVRFIGASAILGAGFWLGIELAQPRGDCDAAMMTPDGVHARQSADAYGFFCRPDAEGLAVESHAGWGIMSSLGADLLSGTMSTVSYIVGAAAAGGGGKPPPLPASEQPVRSSKDPCF